jgi:hypothetical protein
MAPAALYSKRMDATSYLKGRVLATKIRALSAKAGEHPATAAWIKKELKVLLHSILLFLNTQPRQALDLLRRSPSWLVDLAQRGGNFCTTLVGKSKGTCGSQIISTSPA